MISPLNTLLLIIDPQNYFLSYLPESDRTRLATHLEAFATQILPVPTLVIGAHRLGEALIEPGLSSFSSSVEWSEVREKGDIGISSATATAGWVYVRSYPGLFDDDFRQFMKDQFPAVDHLLFAGAYTTSCIPEVMKSTLREGFRVTSLIDLMADAECPEYETDKVKWNDIHLNLSMTDFLQANSDLAEKYRSTHSANIIAALPTPERTGGGEGYKNKTLQPYSPGRPDI